jgi:hypothetical protein
MLIVLEIVLLASVGLSVCRIMRNTFSLNLILGCVFLLAAAAAYSAGWLAATVTHRIPMNLLVAAGISTVFSMAAYIVVFHFLSRPARRRSARQAERSEVSPRTGWAGRIGNLLLSVLLVTSVVLVVDFLVELASASHLADTVSEKTLFLRCLMPPTEKTDEGKTDQEVLADIIDEQARFLESLRSGIEKSRRKLAETVGTPVIVQQTRALVALLNLPPEDSAWLIENTPELSSLQSNATVRAIMDDEEVLDLIIQVGEGSMRAVYRLSEHPAIEKLANDEELAEALNVLDLVALEEQARGRREEREIQRPTPNVQHPTPK